MRTRTILALVLVAAVAAACGTDEPTIRSGPTPAPTTPPAAETAGALDVPPIDDAEALRDHLLELAEQNVTEDAGEGIVPSFGVFQAWEAAYPDLSFAGYAVEPDEQTVSTYSNLLNAKELEGEDNPYIIAFSIMDTGGTCLGGVIVGYPIPDTFEPVEPANAEEPCHPLALAAAGGYEAFG